VSVCVNVNVNMCVCVDLWVGGCIYACGCVFLVIYCADGCESNICWCLMCVCLKEGDQLLFYLSFFVLSLSSHPPSLTSYILHLSLSLSLSLSFCVYCVWCYFLCVCVHVCVCVWVGCVCVWVCVCVLHPGGCVRVCLRMHGSVDMCMCVFMCHCCVYLSHGIIVTCTPGSAMASLLVASSTMIGRRACTAFVATAVGMAFHSSAAFSTTASASAAKRVSLFQNQEYYRYYKETYRPIHSEEETKFLCALAKTPLVEEKVSDHVVGYSFEESLPMEQETHAPNVLYARNFYPRLLGKIRGFRKAVLIGNPGTGKSVFQFYYLMSLLHPEKFPDAFPPNKKDERERERERDVRCKM